MAKAAHDTHNRKLQSSMLLGDLAAAAELSLPDGARAIDIRGVSADSRTVGRGFLFAALAGVAADGARFATDAVGRGAVAVVAGKDARLDPRWR
jgi:UDP-N-acetylmuramoyl-L-alanyl-D-glutamate--2,6-diaminopimelate ligase